ncbi:MAG: FHA domain-containing protein [Deltaproteobacteria bacterium]|nr:FHA domain-containing protein [Deltaproteobacteria bacterium]
MLEKRGGTRNRPVIEVISGALEGKKIALGLTMVTVGKDEGMDLPITDDEAAAAHAGFLLWKGEVRVFDFGTEAGTFVNGERVAETALADNDEIQIGSTRFRFIGNA